jgi:PfaD family protein
MPWAGLTYSPTTTSLGWWTGETVITEPAEMRRALRSLSQPLYVLKQDDGWALGLGGTATFAAETTTGDASPILAYVPALQLRQLGDPAFCLDHHLRFPYMVGAMANGISSTELVAAAAKAGLLASFGAAGLRLPQIERAIDLLEAELGDLPWCVNLIHSPNEPAHEAAVVDLYLRRNVRRVEASAFLDLTLPAVLYRVHGIHRGRHGEVVAPNCIIAKASRQELATKWFSPPPPRLLAELVAAGRITQGQAELAGQIPMAQDLTAEADSAGHTDNRPALTLLPTMLAVRDRLQEQFGYAKPLRVGLGGGIGTPASAAAAFAMGAAYIVTGSINQACMESGSSDRVRLMLAQTQQADVIMAPAADMFEMGVKLQVIKRGTMFPMRAAKLFELYRAHNSLEEIPRHEREAIEKTIFRDSLENIWQKTRQFFMELDPSHIARAERDPKHEMALIFRWYLGLSSRWANSGDATRQVDYQIWCGPAMGAFNEWARGSFLEEPANRRVGVIALNLLHGAGVTTRINALRNQGVRLSSDLAGITPQSPAELEEQLR